MSGPVSVAMATYDGLRWIEEQVVSILDSLGPDDELVVVDDGSTDGTWDWLVAYPDRRLRAYRNPVNLGVRRSFERALRLARHDPVFLADQDDIWEPGKRETMLAAFETDPSVTIVVSDASIIDGDGHLVAPTYMAGRGGFDGSLAGTIRRNRFIGCAMAVRRRVLDVALPIPPRAPMHDWWLGAVGAALGRVAYVDAPLLRYRRHGGNASPSRSPSVMRAVQWRIDLVGALVARLLAHRRGRPPAARPPPELR